MDALQRLLRVLVAAALAGAVPRLEAAPPPLTWPVWRGNPALTGTAPGKLSANLELLWSFKAADSIRSSPVAGYGRIFFGSHDGKIYALNPDTGGLVWAFETGDAVECDGDKRGSD